MNLKNKSGALILGTIFAFTVSFCAYAEDTVVPSDYLVENAADYVTAGDFSGLSATEYQYEITDDDVKDEAIYQLGLYDEEKEVSRGAEAGDVIYFDYSYTVKDTGEEDEDSSVLDLGEAEYGEAFDENLMGAEAGDTLNFTIAFDEEEEDDTLFLEDAWYGETVDFEVSVESVCEIVEAVYSDETVAENSDYDTIEDFEAAVRESLEYEYEETGYYDAVSDLIEQAMNLCEFSGYPEDLYDVCYNETVYTYTSFMGTDDIDEILDLFGMTEDDLADEVVSLVNERLLVSYICVENGIEISEEDYAEYIDECAYYYGYDSTEDFTDALAEEDVSYLVWTLYETEAGDYLYDLADISFETASLSDSWTWDYDDEDDEDEEDWDDEDWDDEDWDDEDWDDEDWDDEDWDDEDDEDEED